MKLKTKFQDEDFELGEVADVDITTMPDGCFKARAKAMRGGLHTFYYDTKADFDAEWEDAPEKPKLYYVIDLNGEILASDLEDQTIQKCEEIGNYFESKEEVEKAVEKLKAWKRLRDKGFRFRTFYAEDDYIVIRGGSDTTSSLEMWRDLEILFRGEE